MSGASSERMFLIKDYPYLGDLINETSCLATSARGLLECQLESPNNDSMHALYAVMQMIEAALEKAEQMCPPYLGGA